MPLPHWVVAWGLLAAAAVAGSPLDPWFGAVPSERHRYEAGELHCEADGVTVPRARINDDYCDCPISALDEPGTSACSDGQFYCRNVGYVPSVLPSSRVNDGVCDCCDGSDEYAGHVTCPMACAERGASMVAELKSRYKSVIVGLRQRDAAVKEGHALRASQVARLEELKRQADAKQIEVNDLKSKKDAAEVEEAAEKERQRQIDEAEQAKRRANEEAERQQQQQQQQRQEADAEVSESMTSPATVPADDAAGPSADDQPPEVAEGATPSKAFPYPEQYAFHGEDEQQDSRGDDEQQEYAEDYDEDVDESEPVAPEPATETSPTILGRLRDAVLGVFSGWEPFRPTRKNARAAANEARRVHQDAENALLALDKERKTIEQMLNMDFGKDDAFRVLQDKCFTLSVDQYTYTLCPFKSVTQSSGGSDTSLGRFKRWDDQSGDWLFEQGQRCWNGPERSTRVSVSCGQTNELLDVSEPSTCVYVMHFATPCACDQEDVDGIVDNLRVLSLTDAQITELSAERDEL
ncbi:Glucosidase 2 subunit beta [Plasmodiophora brassicae]